MLTFYEEAVDRSIKLLDEKNPTWRDKIDIEQLNINHPYLCVLGQLYGSYAVGLYRLGLKKGHVFAGYGFNGCPWFGPQYAHNCPLYKCPTNETLTTIWKLNLTAETNELW